MALTKKEMEFANYLVNAMVGALKATPTSVKEEKKANGRRNATEVKKEEKVSTTKYSTSIKDYAPKKGADGHYIWGRKTDTVKSKNYLAMQKAYCYAVATNGQALTSDECLKLGLEVDYEKTYNKAKADFRKKYVYVAKSERD